MLSFAFSSTKLLLERVTPCCSSTTGLLPLPVFLYFPCGMRYMLRM